MKKEIVFNSNPFLRKEGGFEEPKQAIHDHWITKQFGFEVFISANKAQNWIYIKVGPEQILMATPEFLNDTSAAVTAFIKIKEAVK